MEGIRWKLVAILLLIILLSCVRNADNASSKLEGHWYAIYGGPTKKYGEAIYKNGAACFYSDELGLRYREYRVKADSTLEIYNKDLLDNVRKLSFQNSNTMMQTLVTNEPLNVVNGIVNYYKVADVGISYERLFSLDTIEQHKFINGFMLRKAQWEIRQ